MKSTVVVHSVVRSTIEAQRLATTTSSSNSTLVKGYWQVVRVTTSISFSHPILLALVQLGTSMNSSSLLINKITTTRIYFSVVPYRLIVYIVTSCQHGTSMIHEVG